MKHAHMHRLPVQRLHPQKQSGVALVLALVLLLIMSIIGISSVRTVAMEEKMATASHDRSLAFQAAEAALRTGEASLASLMASGNIPADLDVADYTAPYSEANCKSKTVTCDTGTGVCARPLPGCTARWETGASPAAPWVAGPTMGVSPHQVSTQYMAEVFSRDAACVGRILKQDVEAVCTAFRVTARSTPRDDRASVMLQTIYIYPN